MSKQTQNEYIDIFFRDKKMVEKYPDDSDRLSAAFDSWKKSKQKTRTAERRYSNGDYNSKIELRIVGEKKIEGYAAVFNSWSVDLGGFREIIRPGCFAKTLQEADIRCLFNHDMNLVLGRQSAKKQINTVRYAEDKTGLYFECDLPDTTLGSDIRASMERGDIDQCSFGFETIKDIWTDDFSKRELLEAKLFDAGPVTYPAYPDTMVGVRSTGKIRNEHICNMLEKRGYKIDNIISLIDAITKTNDLSDTDIQIRSQLIEVLKSAEPGDHSVIESVNTDSMLTLRRRKLDIMRAMGGL